MVCSCTVETIPIDLGTYSHRSRRSFLALPKRLAFMQLGMDGPSNQLAEPPAALVLFARLPVPGKAKTRLAAGVGGEAAAELYRACAENTFRQALRLEGRLLQGCGRRPREAGPVDWRARMGTKGWQRSRFAQMDRTAPHASACNAYPTTQHRRNPIQNPGPYPPPPPPALRRPRRPAAAAPRCARRCTAPPPTRRPPSRRGLTAAAAACG